MRVYVCLPEFMCTRCVQMSAQDRREHHIPWNWSYEVVVSHHVDVENHSSVLHKAVNPLIHFMS